MGASLVAGAIQNVFPYLDRHHRSRVALTVMANTALDGVGKDGQQPGEYFGGYGPIACALGLADDPNLWRHIKQDHPDYAATFKRRRLVYKTVSEALKPLLRLGAISVIETSAPEQRNAKYSINVLRVPARETWYSDPSRDRTTTSNGVHRLPVTGTSVTCNGVERSPVTRGQRNHEEPPQAIDDSFVTVVEPLTAREAAPFGLKEKLAARSATYGPRIDTYDRASA